MDNRHDSNSVAGDEIDISGLLAMLILHKTLILTVFILGVIGSFIYVFFIAMPVYRVNAVLAPGTCYDEWGAVKLIDNQLNLESILKSGAFNQKIAQELNVGFSTLDRLLIITEIDQGSNYISIRVDHTSPQMVKKILDRIIHYTEKFYDERVDIAKRNLVIANVNLVAARKEINTTIQKLKKNENQIRENLSEVMEQQELSGPSEEGVYKNLAVSQVLGHLIDLIKEQGELLEKVSQISEQIDRNELNISNIKAIKVLKSPTISEKPVKPNKKMVVGVASFIALFLGIMFSFFLDLYRTALQKLAEN